MKIKIINGANLNLLGSRETSIYGTTSFDTFLNKLRAQYQHLEISYFQSNIEGAIINELHDSSNIDGVIINPGGYSHTSVAIADAISAIKTPVIEVHISNIYAREPFRHQSITGSKSLGVISGLGLDGYSLALQFLLNNVTNKE